MPTTAPLVFDERDFLDRVGDDYELAADVARLFLDDCPRRLDAMREALAKGDATGLRMEAHGLKGAAGNMAAATLSAAALELEEAAARQDLEAAGRLFATMCRDASAVMEAVRAFDTTSVARSG